MRALRCLKVLGFQSLNKVSIIIPVYQVEAFIKRCLQSVLRQTYQNFEIICVDDSGTDGSMGIVRDFAERYADKIKIIESTANVGLGAARDKGIAAAEGEFICFVDSDDFIDEEFLEQYVREAVSKNADMVVGGYDRTDGRKHRECRVRDDDDLFAWTHPNSWAKLYRTSFLRRFGLTFMGVRRNEDERFVFRILEHKPVIAQIDNVGYAYWINTDSLTMSRAVDRTKHFEKYAETACKTLDTVHFTGSERELFEYCFFSYLTAAFLYYGRGCGWNRMKELRKPYEMLVSKFPNICNNKYIPFKYLKSETSNNRFATWMVLRFKRIHLENLLFWFCSQI